MAAPTSAGGSHVGPDPNGRLTLAPDTPTSEHPEVVAWLAEAKRLFAEAEDRLKAGKVLPALSSLAAVPPLHRMLVEHCSELLDAGDGDAEQAPPPCGMYL
jgi:hypothetical protein